MKTTTKRFVVGFVALALLGLLVAAIGPLAPKQQAPQVVQNLFDHYLDGSSTVFPVTEVTTKTTKEYNQAAEQQIQIKVGISGTGGGFRKFCSGVTDITDASRPSTPEEMKACDQAGVRYYELPVAFDALTLYGVAG